LQKVINWFVRLFITIISALISATMMRVSVHDVRFWKAHGGQLMVSVFHFASGTLSATMTKIDDLHTAGC